MRINITDALCDNVDTLRKRIADSDDTGTYFAARSTLNSISFADLSDEMSAEDAKPLVEEPMYLSNTINVGDLDGYAYYLIGHHDADFLPEDQFLTLDDAHTVYVAMLLMFAVTKWQTVNQVQ